MERFLQHVGADRVAVDVELLEDGLVEEPPAVVGGLPVGLLKIVEKFEGGVENGGAGFEAVVGVLELGCELGAFLLDAVEALSDLAGGQCAVGGEVEQVVLLDVELGELLRELLSEELGRLVAVGRPQTIRLLSSGTAAGIKRRVLQPIYRLAVPVVQMRRRDSRGAASQHRVPPIGPSDP